MLYAVWFGMVGGMRSNEIERTKQLSGPEQMAYYPTAHCFMLPEQVERHVLSGRTSAQIRFNFDAPPGEFIASNF